MFMGHEFYLFICKTLYPTLIMCLYSCVCVDKPWQRDARGFTAHDEVLNTKNGDRLWVCGDLRRPFVCIEKLRISSITKKYSNSQFIHYMNRKKESEDNAWCYKHTTCHKTSVLSIGMA